MPARVVRGVGARGLAPRGAPPRPGPARPRRPHAPRPGPPTTFEAAGTGSGLLEGDGLAGDRRGPESAATTPGGSRTAGGGRRGGLRFVWCLRLPGAVKEDVWLVRRGDELLLTVGPFRRIVPLPSVLRRCTVSGAGLTDGVLRVRFTPDPELWPRAR